MKIEIELNAKVIGMLDGFKTSQLVLLKHLADEGRSGLEKHWLTRAKEYENADYAFLADEYLFDRAIRELGERGEKDG